MSSHLLRSPAVRVRSELFVAQELVEIETNPVFHPSTRLEVLGKRYNNSLYQLDFA